MNIQIMRIADIQVRPDGLRRPGRRQLKAIARSLERFGQQKPVVVDEASILLAGHATLLAAASLGWLHLAAVRSTLSGHEALAYAIADNRCGELAAWREGVLATRLAELEIDPAKPARACGFNRQEIEALAGRAARCGQRSTRALASLKGSSGATQAAPAVSGVHQVLVSCHDETDQRRVYEALAQGGYTCRVLTLS